MFQRERERERARDKISARKFPTKNPIGLVGLVSPVGQVSRVSPVGTEDISIYYILYLTKHHYYWDNKVWP